jgi:hypothetical protein
MLSWSKMFACQTDHGLHRLFVKEADRKKEHLEATSPVESLTKEKVLEHIEKERMKISGEKPNQGLNKLKETTPMRAKVGRERLRQLKEPIEKVRVALYVATFHLMGTHTYSFFKEFKYVNVKRHFNNVSEALSKARDIREAVFRVTSSGGAAGCATFP